MEGVGRKGSVFSPGQSRSTNKAPSRAERSPRGVAGGEMVSRGPCMLFNWEPFPGWSGERQIRH